MERAVPCGVRSWRGERALVTLAKNGWLPAPPLPAQLLPKITSSPLCSPRRQRPSGEGDATRWIPRAPAWSLGIPALLGDVGGPSCPRSERWAMLSLASPAATSMPARYGVSLLSAPQLPITPALRSCLQGFIGNSAAACRGFTVPGLAPPGPALGVFGLRLLSLVHLQQFVPRLVAARLRSPLQPVASPARHEASPAAWHLERSWVLV